jgi:hypothetical protein
MRVKSAVLIMLAAVMLFFVPQAFAQIVATPGLTVACVDQVPSLVCTFVPSNIPSGTPYTVTGTSDGVTATNTGVLLSVANIPLSEYGGPGAAVPESYFGMHYLNLNDPYPPFTIGIWRIWSNRVTWPQLETASGTYGWSALDRIVSFAQAHNVPDILYTIGKVPSWNSSNPTDTICSFAPGACDPNASDAEFIAFVNALTQRYCGRIRYYEVWNEPNNGGGTNWNASISLFVMYLKDAYAAIHSTANCACTGTACSPGQAGGTNPNVVLMPSLDHLGGSQAGTHGEVSWFRSFLAAGAANYFDIANLHSYRGTTDGYTVVGLEQFIPDVAAFKQVLDDNNLQAKPVWNTEMDWGNPDLITDEPTRNTWIARFVLLHWALGFPRAIWYAYSSSSSGAIPPGSTEVTAYAQVQKWMLGAVEQNCTQYENSNWICSFTRTLPSGYQAQAVWNATGSGTYIVPTGITQFRDVLGNITPTSPGASVPLTTSPLLFETASAF